MKSFISEDDIEQAICNRLSLPEYALRWILQQEGVTSVLVGASSVEQLKQNLRCTE